jgi:molybdopterin adenylyltransferase
VTRSAVVLTISDGVTAGTRVDESGQALAARLADMGFSVERVTVPDDSIEIATAIARAAAGGAALVISTGGTGLGPRDRTPQTLHGLLDYEIPGFGELMRAYGREITAMADLSRSMAGVLGSTLVIATPGSRSGALDSLAAIAPILNHALETLGGDTQHGDGSNTG